MEEFFILLLIITVAAFITGTSGFGSNLITLPLLIYFFEYKEVLPIIVTINIMLNITMLKSSKKFSLNVLKDIWVIVFLGVTFTFVGIWLLNYFDSSIIITIAGIFIILTVINKLFVNLLFNIKFIVSDNILVQVVVGILSGLMNGLAAMGGLAVLIYLSNREIEKDDFKVTLVTYFFVMNVMNIIGYIANGQYTSVVITNISYYAIPAIIATLIGVKLSSKINDKTFQIVVSFILLAMGINMLF
ncbi:MAG: sulfite exporter TauE/SafE family protein [Candidatus Izemoplasma sp.]